MLTFFRPKPGRFGIQAVLLTSGRINTGTLAAGTQTHTIGTHPAKCFINRVSVSAGTYPTATTNTVKLVRYDAAGTTARDITDALDVNTKTARTSLSAAIASAATDSVRTLLPGDTLEVVLVTTGTVTTQPDDLVVTVELLPLE